MGCLRNVEQLNLGSKQSLFARLVGTLIAKIYADGYECTLGEAWRPPETAELYKKQGKGVARSLHTERLAIDLNLFRNGIYLMKTEDHEPFGTWWEAQHELCRWGGRFKGRPDGNHYSLEHEGRK